MACFEMRKAGATTFGQNEETSLIYGMPQAAFNCGAVMQQYPLNKVGRRNFNSVRQGDGCGVVAQRNGMKRGHGDG